ncbi:hypothetical protein KCU90_g81, partial [Aureobasidium melanogenum]
MTETKDLSLLHRIIKLRQARIIVKLSKLIGRAGLKSPTLFANGWKGFRRHSNVQQLLLMTAKKPYADPVLAGTGASAPSKQVF